MNRKYIYAGFVLIFLIAIAGVAFNYGKKEKQKEERTYELLPRKGAAAQSLEWKEVQKKVADLQAILKQEPTDLNANIRLAAIFIQEARETGNYVYYDMAALKSVNTVLKSDPNNFNALVYRALIMLSQHHFEDGLNAAKAAQKVNPYNAYVYGLLVDGYVEMGQYDSAIANSDRMVSIRPDLTSYSRVSYLREIFGNYKAAIDAMKMAAEAGGRGDEHTEWTRVHLAGLYEKIGNYKTADTLYQTSLALRPGYPFALAGLARVATASGDYKKAIEVYEQALQQVSDNGIKDELADVYRLSGNKAKADKLTNEMIDELNKDANAANGDEDIGHYSDKELAYAYLKVDNTGKAMEHAMLEYNRRPDNIDVNEAVAWVNYNRDEAIKALPYVKAALKTGSKNPVLLSRAGLIYFKAGDKVMAKTLLLQAADSHSFVGEPLKSETDKVLQSL